MTLLAAAFARVGTGTARALSGGPVHITHPVKGYTGPVTAGGLRLHFVGGETDAINLKASARRALEEAGFTVANPRAATGDSADDGQ